MATAEKTYEALPANSSSIRIEHKDGSHVNLIRSTLGLGGYDFEAYSQSSDPVGRGTVGLSFISQFLSEGDKIWIDGEQWKPPQSDSLEKKDKPARPKQSNGRRKVTKTRPDSTESQNPTAEQPSNRQTSRNA